MNKLIKRITIFPSGSSEVIPNRIMEGTIEDGIEFNEEMDNAMKSYERNNKQKTIYIPN